MGAPGTHGLSPLLLFHFWPEGNPTVPHGDDHRDVVIHSPRRRFDFGIRVTAPPQEGRKEGAKHIKT